MPDLQKLKFEYESRNFYIFQSETK